jgi:TRAP transporter 4TM/12TM fusion protein
MGSISGSAIANAVTTGTFTIPMMKKLGYRAEQAAGIEAAASTGGQIMPPIMGAGAFVMAELTNTPYNEIVAISVVPALLYFLATLIFVHVIAVRRGLSVMTELPSLRRTLGGGYHFLFPLALVTVLLFLDYSPPVVGTVGCAAVVVAGALSPRTRVGPMLLLDGLKRGALMALPISTACATAGVVVGAIGQTGAGLQFTESVLELASGQLWLALVLVTLAALVLGMGLPATAAYIVIAVMAAPALDDLGLTLLASHMILFWLSQISNVTPPIALAAFAAAGIRRRQSDEDRRGSGQALRRTLPHPAHDGVLEPAASRRGFPPRRGGGRRAHARTRRLLRRRRGRTGDPVDLESGAARSRRRLPPHPLSRDREPPRRPGDRRRCVHPRLSSCENESFPRERGAFFSSRPSSRSKPSRIVSG